MTENAAGRLTSKLVEIVVELTIAAIRILLIVAVAYALTKIARAALNRLELLLVRASEAKEKEFGSAAKRIKTLINVLWTISAGLIWFIAALVSLGQIGIDLGPILAGAGIVGLAVGFGAQHLVRDLVSGFFLILENQIRVGDAAVINGTGGNVESISFRTVVLRDQAGVVHVFPNGSIRTLSNMSKDWSAYVLDIPVAYKEDTDKVIDIMRRVGDGMRAEPKYGAVMLEPMEIFGVDAFTQSAVTIKARIKTLPQQQDPVGREFRRRLKKAFDEAGIEIPVSSRPNAPKTGAVAPARTDEEPELI
jgi:small-conductance mechanosensitive channel